MQSEIHLQAIDTHTAGMPTRIVTSGHNLSFTSAGSVEAQRDAFSRNQDHLRKQLMREPRGHQDMFGAVPTIPATDDADLGLFFMDHEGYLDMCGHATMGVITALLETNQLEYKSPLKIETPAGMVEAFPEMENGRVTRVGVKNVTSYVVDTLPVSIEEQNDQIDLTAAIIYAGNYFAMVDAQAIAPKVTTNETKKFIESGLDIRSYLNENHDITDPISGESITVDLVEFYDGTRDVDRNIVIFADGAVDRSPCGTGTCAKMTLLNKESKLDLHEEYPHESVIGTRFEGEIESVTTSNGVSVTTPIVRGSAYIVADHTFVLDSEDPIPSFSVTD